ncbi:MAG TPA: DUF1326 domain-containing protein [Pyrinomonadaceae bacterium]|nr:DUF1326 domain-containing protein [Pyrinomonadaceae bacterium]
MSAEEIYANGAQDERRSSRRFAIILAASILIVFALTVGALYALFTGKLRRNAPVKSAAPSSNEAVAKSESAAFKWKIAGALSEACTCSVPCTCNFGEGPSPHSYCYPFYSYEIRKGNYGDIVLDGLHFGAADMKSGRTIFIDERADERQRQALKLIAMRVIVHTSAEDAETRAREYEPSTRYAAITQAYGQGSNHLKVEGVGEFAGLYIMGQDKSQPIVVRNNTTWRVRDTIKAKTSLYRVQVGRDRLDVKDTNSNQGEFEYTDKTDFGAPAAWNCGACANDKQSRAGEQACGQ